MTQEQFEEMQKRLGVNSLGSESPSTSPSSSMTTEQKLKIIELATDMYTAGRVGSLQEGIERIQAVLKEESLWK